VNKLLVSLLLYLTLISTAWADVYNPAYLEIRQTGEETVAVLWKVPAVRLKQRPGIHLELPPDLKPISQRTMRSIDNAVIESFSATRPNGLTGAEVSINGLSKTSDEVLVRVAHLDGSAEFARLTPENPSFVISPSPAFREVISTYLIFGTQHIWEGNDHLLFVACLIFIAGTWQRILITITGFTIAHSITLTLAALNLVHVPVPPVEAVIALSIVFLANEIARGQRNSLTWRHPITVSVFFGLLHGFGFASALADIGLPQNEIPAALLAFNIGVEIGQILFVAALICIAWVGKTVLYQLGMSPFNLTATLEKPMAYAAGGIAMFWMIERVSTF
jgi:hydrogenase/urease accessory protein HupE